MAAILIYKTVIDPDQIIGCGCLVFIGLNGSADIGSYQFELYTHSNTIKLSTGCLIFSGAGDNAATRERTHIKNSYECIREALLKGYDLYNTAYPKH